VRERLWAAARIPAALHALRAAFAAGGGVHPPRAAACSLVRSTGPRRRFAVARVDLAALRAAAHRHGGTVNDALLARSPGRCGTSCHAAGRPSTFLRVSVLVAARTRASSETLGNAVAPLLVDVLAGVDPTMRLARTAGVVRAARAAQAARPGAGGPRWSRRCSAPPPRSACSTGTWPTRSGCTPPQQRAGTGGTARHRESTDHVDHPDRGQRGRQRHVTATALSYAGTLTVTLIVDPDRVPDLPALATALQTELDALATTPLTRLP
jgi:hypothetical protein